MSEGRRPRALLKIGGTACGIIDYTVENNTFFQCDTFKATIGCWQQAEGFGIDYWDDAAPVNVEILIGFLAEGADPSDLPSGLTSLIIGQVDDATCDTTAGTIELSGRDLTALLIDNKTTQTWPDQTASQIVTMLAGMVGLKPQVTATTTPVGKYSKDAYAAVSRETPLWDLITTYAKQEGFDAYVTGTTLYFGPPQADTDPNPFPIACSTDPATNEVNTSVETLNLKRSLTMAKDITVTVIAHSLKTGKPVKEIASRQGVKSQKSSQSKSQSAQNYVIRRPNLSPQQALQLATKTLADLTIHERTFDATTWDDGTLNAKRKARISGTGTSFDTDYFLDKVIHTFGFGKMSVTLSGKNHPTETELAQ